MCVLFFYEQEGAFPPKQQKCSPYLLIWTSASVCEFVYGILPRYDKWNPIDSIVSHPVLQLICDSTVHKEHVKAPHLSAPRAFSVQIPRHSPGGIQRSQCHSNDIFLSVGRCVCSFFTPPWSPVITCCHSPISEAVSSIRCLFVYGLIIQLRTAFPASHQSYCNVPTFCF